MRLDEFGYLYTGAAPQLPVVDFLECQMLTTYPTLEISLICGFKAGLVPRIISLIILWANLVWICRRLCNMV